MPQKNDLAVLEITGVTHEGCGVGRLQDGMAVFVPGAAENDRLQVRLVKLQKNYCYGKIEQILAPSPDRITPDCPVSTRCGGCVFRHISYEAELRHKQAFVQENLRRIGGFSLCCEPILPSPQENGYRNKAQYPVQQGKNGLIAGFYAQRTHEVVDARDCRLQPAGFSKVLEAVLAYMQENHLPAYDEKTGRGLVRHLYLRQGARSGELMVCLVVNGKSLPAENRLIERLLGTKLPIVSVVLNENRQNTNVILGNKTRLLYGKETIADDFCDMRFSLSAQAFYQVNSPAAEQLYALAADYAGLTGQELLLDLYCGAGTIGLSMAAKAREVIGVEVVPQAVENARENARQNGIKNARFLCADAAKAAASLEQEGAHPDVVVLDPPRKGCDPETLEAVARMNPQRVVYISCNSATLARDCALLCERGYRLERCRPVDLFPRTVHVETVCLLSKLRSDHHIEVNLDMDELDLTAAESKATYEEIKEYVLEKSGLKVSSLYIAQIKEKMGIEKRENYNHSKKEDANVPQCPVDKEKAIMEALKHFSMID